MIVQPAEVFNVLPDGTHTTGLVGPTIQLPARQFSPHHLILVLDWIAGSGSGLDTVDLDVSTATIDGAWNKVHEFAQRLGNDSARTLTKYVLLTGNIAAEFQADTASLREFVGRFMRVTGDINSGEHRFACYGMFV